ncbi:MAG: PIN domain-containing protein [Trueperaceae bacterium]|nr:PIN domain-containing protein [Trueperaceae bacterium]
MTRTAIDSNVIVALWSREPMATRMAQLLRAARAAGPLAVAAPVWAELHAAPGATPEFVARFLADTEIAVDFHLDEPVWRHAAQAFAAYADRRRASGGGHPQRLLVDFVVGAHAVKRADRLLTLDPDRYRSAFADLRIEPSRDLHPDRRAR